MFKLAWSDSCMVWERSYISHNWIHHFQGCMSRLIHNVWSHSYKVWRMNMKIGSMHGMRELMSSCMIRLMKFSWTGLCLPHPPSNTNLQRLIALVRGVEVDLQQITLDLRLFGCSICIYSCIYLKLGKCCLRASNLS